MDEGIRESVNQQTMTEIANILQADTPVDRSGSRYARDFTTNHYFLFENYFD
jgi:hypothetical protein